MLGPTSPKKLFSFIVGLKAQPTTLFINLFKMLIAGAVAFAVCLACAYEYDILVHLPSLIFEIGKILFVFIVCMAVYVPLNLLMKMDYASELAIRLKNKLSL